MASELDILRQQARELPEVPGVYFWKDSREKTLYIGKAVNLRARVLSYFSNASRDRRTRDLLTRARAISYEVTGTELEALLLESALIKRELPRFNRQLRETRKPYYLKASASLEHPYLERVREVENDKALYVGPFRTLAVLRETEDFLQHVLPLRKCKAEHPKCRPCLYFHMQTCAAPFIDEVHAVRHRQALIHLGELLDGRSDRVIAWLEDKRDRMSEALLFERAAETQQRLDALKELLRKQIILEAAARSRCVLVYQQNDSRTRASLLLVARGTVLSQRDLATMPVVQIVEWVKAHEPLIRATEHRQSEIDAASVLERWLYVNRERVRWVAIPHQVPDEDLENRVQYVIGDLEGNPTEGIAPPVSTTV